MTTLLLKHLRYSAALPLILSAFIVISARPAGAETIYLFRSPVITASNSIAIPRTIQQNTLLKLDHKGDLLIQYGSTRFTVAYNTPFDQFKPSEQPPKPQREYSSNINGISLTASLSF